MSSREESTSLYENGFLFNNRYSVMSRIDERGHGRVFKVKDSFESENNIKCLKLIDDWKTIESKREINRLIGLKHQSVYVVKYYDEFAFQQIKHCIITEFCPNGDLAKLIQTHKQDRKKFNADRIERWNGQLIDAINFLHNNQIIHRDIRPEKIFLTQSDDVKLGELGYAKSVSEIVFRARECNSLSYICPELVDGKMYYDAKIDIWSYGCVLFELITFERVTLVTGSKSSLCGCCSKQEDDVAIPNETSQLNKQILRRSLVKYTSDRASIIEIKQIVIEKLKSDEKVIKKT